MRTLVYKLIQETTDKNLLKKLALRAELYESVEYGDLAPMVLKINGQLFWTHEGMKWALQDYAFDHLKEVGDKVKIILTK